MICVRRKQIILLDCSRSPPRETVSLMKRIHALLVLCCLLVLQSASIAARDVPANGREEKDAVRLQTIADRLRARLDIRERVEVTLVDHNPLVLSVETRAGRSGPFVIRVDAAFINSLSGDEQEASLAHELGHVWIYTHHPYLQTEKLANDIALRVVTRSTLEPVYEKVWKRTGIKGNLAEFIGQF